MVSKKSSVMDKIMAAIRAHHTAKGMSRVAISKYLKSEFDYDNSNAIKKALTKGVADGILIQEGQSFRVASDPVQEQDDAPKVEVKDLTIGKGDPAETGDSVTVSYSGSLEDGHVFDQASKFSFVLGGKEVIKGWDMGLVGMMKGGVRELVVPPELGYGKRGCKPDIPPNATLHFSISMKQIAKSR